MCFKVKISTVNGRNVSNMETADHIQPHFEAILEQFRFLAQLERSRTGE
ncbi:hypothetical protein WUBG_00092 [Wuchereria bancrofti]|uniref:Uncharacterized protein n=1 Tax=Wuchereria bancrofti TaxID=6293 RepID=J9F398_WUCBA|nr:hypothetical protein WUBG_00092 [Wuchereria bancrofti]